MHDQGGAVGLVLIAVPVLPVRVCAATLKRGSNTTAVVDMRGQAQRMFLCWLLEGQVLD